MDIKRNLLVLLAIFCVVASAGIACAADNGSYAESNFQGVNGVSITQQGLEPGTELDLVNQQNPEPGAGLHQENQTDYEHSAGSPLENQTGKMIGNTTGNGTGNATDDATGNVTAGNVHNTTDNATNATSTHALLTTGNPILALLTVSAIIGCYAVVRKE